LKFLVCPSSSLTMKNRVKIQSVAHGITRLELPARTLPPFTHINSYIVATDTKAILIDPGFYEEGLLEIVRQTLQDARLESIILTHTHPDHIEGIPLVRKVYPSIPIYVHELELAKVSYHQYVHALEMNKPLRVGRLELHPIFTPGHSPGHVSFYEPNSRTAIVGDMLAGFGSIWIGAPDGNINDYFESLEKLRALNAIALAPGHGDVIYNVHEKLDEVRQHRLQRLEQVITALTAKPLTLSELRLHIYPEIDERITTLAERSLLALLEKLEKDNKVSKTSNYWNLAHQ
jgi:endoribonuclease LACTB2